MSAGSRLVTPVGSQAARQPAGPVTVIEMDVLFPLIKDTAITSQNEAASLSERQSH